MSDQPSPPPKPKPGSLRDRIAAFEKSASAAAPAPAPAPRPKPAGFSSWKPKVPSPPSSPSAASTDVQSSASTAKAGGMSASDAKESITKAGSLKDRMAALQGKGAFGAPPPVAPKPAVEKPKWKPPPVVQAPADEGDDAGESSSTAIAAAVERTTSPPVSVRSHDSIDNVKSVHEVEEPAAAPEGDNDSEQTPVDPEEEERQRRAAIAVRMARLGGARVGMVPPVFGKKPVRKPTQEEVVKAEEPKSSEEPSVRDVTNAASGEVHLSPPINAIVSPSAEAPIQAESDVGKSAEYLLKRKDSDNASILSSETTESNPSRTPTSMPVPSVPRRAGPPRKKPVKAPTLPPPELTEEKVEELVTPLPEADKLENISTEIPQDVEQPTLVEEAVRIIEKEDPEIMKDPSPEESAPAELLRDVDESRDEDPTLLAHRLESPEISSSSVAEEESGIRSPPPSSLESTFDPLDVDENDDQEGSDGEIAASPPVPVLHTAPHALHADVATPKIEQTLPETSSAPDVLEEEEARKKRVADRMAKMGGINPFAPPPALFSPRAEGARSPPSSTTLSPSPPVQVPAPVVDSEPQELQSNLDSPPVSHAPGAQKEDMVETKVEEESSDEEDESDDVLDNTAHEQYEKSKAANFSHTETHPESVSVTSSTPIPLATRPTVQVQHFEHEGEDEDEESDYGDEEKEEVSVAAPPSSSIPPGHPPPARSPPIAQLDEAPSPTARPAQPPRRVIPQAPEHVQEEEEEEDEEEITDEEADERLATSQLFVPPPSGRWPIAVQPRHRHAQDEEDGSGSENDTPALPVPHRISMEVPPAAAANKAATEDEDEADSDHDGQALPIPPMRNPASVPRVVSPPIPAGRSQGPLHHPPPISRALPTTPQIQANLDHSPGHLTPSLSAGSEEILDEEEGDPIDPSFHSPSRQTSFVNLRSTAQVQAEIAAQAPIPTPTQSPPTVHSAPPPPTQSPPPPPAAHPVEKEPEEDAEQIRRKTIAERMAKLGGIRFGGAPIPTPTSRPQPRQEEEQEHATASAPEEQSSDALSEEEEERARKERISAKLANMGGMRIGMMPMGMGGLPPQKSHILREENVDRSPPVPTPAPQVRAVPPARPPPSSTPGQSPQDQPQSHDTDSDYGASEDGVKVEAEESEAEAGYEHVDEVFPPPVPSRDGRHPQHRQSTGPSTSSPPRPPVPTSMRMRRSSTLQSTKSSGGISSGDIGTSPSQKKSSFMPQSEYVMVEEPESQETPPPPPGRRTSRAPPARTTPQIPQTTPMVARTSDLADSISSQWELPSIPNSSLDFGGGAPDLSLSWTDAAEPTSPIATFQPSQSPPSTAKMTPSMSERQLSADTLMALWGRVGVQVCEVATSLFEKSKKTLIGDGSYAGFINEVLSAVPNAAASPSTSGEYGYVIYVQSGPAVQKRVSEIMPGDIVEIHDAKLKGHKGIQIYHQNVGGSGETLLGVVGEFEAKKSKIRVFQANQHVGQQTVESVSYRLEDLKSGTVKVYRVLDT